MRFWLANAAMMLALLGVAQCIAGVLVVRAFVKRPAAHGGGLPPISVLRPLCGAEPELEAALISCFQQDYPEFEIIFGVARADDPAVAIATRVRERFPAIRSSLVIDASIYGTNRKVSNLINMLPEARHDLLLICDSDLHLAPDYLSQLAGEIAAEGTGLVTALSTGLPVDRSLAARLGATHISHLFLPGVLLSRALGREDCLGSTTLIARGTLERIGGLEAFSSVLAEDNLMSARVRALGLRTRLARCVTTAMVPETSLAALSRHELRWACTIRGVAPVSLASSVLQYPLFWALAALLLDNGGNLPLAVFGLAWFTRAFGCHAIDRSLAGRAGRDTPPVAGWLLPIRDVISVVEVAAAFLTRTVVWRGVKMRA